MFHIDYLLHEVAEAFAARASSAPFYGFTNRTIVSAKKAKDEAATAYCKELKDGIISVESALRYTLARAVEAKAENDPKGAAWQLLELAALCLTGVEHLESRHPDAFSAPWHVVD